MNEEKETLSILKEKLKEKIICPILPDDEKDKIIDEIIEKNPIDQNKTLFNNLRQLTLILNNHLQKTYFPKSPIFSTQDQKIIMLYLSKKDNQFYSEEEIRKLLNVYSGQIYQAIEKLKKKKKEALKLFPNYQKLLKERIVKSKQQRLELSEEDIQLIGYYIGEINYICLDIAEIAKLKQKTEKEITDKLTIIFNLLKEKENLDKILMIYPKREEMLKIKAKTLGINLKIAEKEEKPKGITKINKQEKTKEKSSLSDKQKKLLTLLNNQSLSKEQIAEELNYKNQTCLNNTIYHLKRKAENNPKLKEEILKINPTFFNQRKKGKEKTTKEKLNLSDKHKKLLTLLNDESLSKKQIAEELNYKNQPCLNNTIYQLKRKAKNNPKLKEEILEINPTFFDQRKKGKRITTEELNLSDKHKKLLTLLNDESLSKKQIAEKLNYKDKRSLHSSIYQLKRKAENNPKLKEEILEINPDFFEQKNNKKSQLSSKQKKLIALINDHSLTREQILQELEYNHSNSLNCTIYNLRKKAENNNTLKSEILKINPTFFNKKSKTKTTTTKSTESKLTEQELTILNEIYQITPPQTAYQTKKTISRKLKIPYTQIERIKKQALEKMKNPDTQKQILKIWPSFIEDKIIKENYKTKNRTIINERALHRMKSFVRQYDIPESNKKEEKSNAILHGIKNLEESIFKLYVDKCSMEQKAILALRLGYFNYPLNSKNIAEIFHIEEQEVITLTKKCLEESRPQQKAEKIKIKK